MKEIMGIFKKRSEKLINEEKKGTPEDFEARYQEYTCKKHGRIFATQALIIHLMGLEFVYCLKCLVNILDAKTEARVKPRNE